MVLYVGDEHTPWFVGSVVSTDGVRPLLEVHRYGSYELRKGKQLENCKFRPAYVDPKDHKAVYTDRPLLRYQPTFDHVEFAHRARFLRDQQATAP